MRYAPNVRSASKTQHNKNTVLPCNAKKKEEVLTSLGTLWYELMFPGHQTQSSVILFLR